MHYLRFYIKIIFFFFTFATKYDLYKMNNPIARMITKKI